MIVKLKLAAVGMNMEVGTITRWYVHPGDTFAKDQPLYEVETEKVTQDVAAPAAGKLLEILVREEQDADVGQDLCVIDMETGR